MMTQELRFCVLSAPLAAIDRRALSQAWYSSLHLARERSPKLARNVPVFAHDRRGGAPSQRMSPSGAELPLHAVPRAPRTCNETLTKRVERDGERRAIRSPLARKIESAFLNPRRPAHRVTFTLETSRARVHVMLAQLPGSMRLVAVCPPDLRAAVARALEEARYALASRGISISMTLEEA